MWGDCVSQNVHCHWLPVGHMKRCDKTVFHNVTYSLLVIEDVMRPSYTKCAMSLTCCWLLEKMWWNCLWENVQYHWLPVGHRKRCDETELHKMWNVTHKLGHRERCDETVIHKMCNVTHSLLVIEEEVMRLCFTKCGLNVIHSLLVIGKDVMRLCFTKCAMSLTRC